MPKTRPKSKKLFSRRKKSSPSFLSSPLKRIGCGLVVQGRFKKTKIAITALAVFIIVVVILVCLKSIGPGTKARPVWSPAKSDVAPTAGSRPITNIDRQLESAGFAIYTFHNLANRTMMLYRVSENNEYIQNVQIPSLGTNGFYSVKGHRYVWAEMGPDGHAPMPTQVKRVHEFSIAHSKVYSFIDTSTKPADRQTLEDEMQFRHEYYLKTGIHWAGTTSPRPSITLPIIEAAHVGQLITVRMHAKASHWHCTIPAPKRVEEQRDDPRSQQYIKQCLLDGTKPDRKVTSQAGPAELVLEATSIRPRIFTVQNFLSKFETDYMISQARPMLDRSTTGSGANVGLNSIRTSEVAYLSRNHSEIMDSIYRRVAIVTSIPEKLLTLGQNIKELNVLHYDKGKKYDSHYDWEPDGRIESRFLSGLLYLNTPIKGGGTSFPLTEPNVKVHAHEGNFVFFYDLLADGNGDIYTLHAGDTVLEGHKWIAPLWIWEPSISGRPHPLGDISKMTHPSTMGQEL